VCLNTGFQLLLLLNGFDNKQKMAIANISVIGISCLLFTCLLAVIITHYCFFEFRVMRRGFKELRSNQFLKLTLIGNVSVLLYISIFTAFFLPTNSLSPYPQDSIAYIIPMQIAMWCHVQLLKLRNSGLLSASFIQVIKFLSICFKITVILFMATNFAFLWFPVNSKGYTTVSDLYKVFGSIETGSLAFIDAISAYNFVHYAQQVNKNLSQQKSSSSLQFQIQENETISRVGTAIAIVSFGATMTFVVDQLTTGFNHDIVLLVASCLTTLVGELWIFMKIKLHFDKNPDSIRCCCFGSVERERLRHVSL
jgi:hypothetical protein